MIVLMGADLVQVAEIVIVELVQVHVSIAFDHLFAFVGSAGYLRSFLTLCHLSKVVFAVLFTVNS